MLKFSRMAMLAACSVACSQASAQELLTNTSLFVADGPVGWNLIETSSSAPSITPNSASLAQFAPQAGAQHLWLQAFRGLFVGNGNELTSAILEQTVPAVVGDSYTFSGYSLFEGNYSGGVDTLDIGSPSGAAPSPTQTLFELAFLDGGGAVIGSPTVFDVEEAQSNGAGWIQHTLNGVAPASAASVRVRASAIDMIANVDPGQSAFLDNFSLTRSGDPSTQQLANNDLEVSPPGNAPGWTATGIGVDSYADFAANTGATGFWIQSFQANIEPVDVTLSQTVPATAGTEYQLSAFSFFETGYAGGVDTLDANSPFGAIPSPTETLLTIEFLDGDNAVLSTSSLDLRTVQMNDRTWRQHFLNGVAPVGTVNARVGVQAFDVVANIDPPGAFQNANFDDFSFVAITGLDGDFNDDGIVDAADYTVWRDNLGGNSSALNGNGSGAATVVQADYDLWKTNFGSTALGGAIGGAVPEPATLWVALGGCLAGLGSLRRRSGK